MTREFVWHPVHEHRKLIYYELCVRIGELRVWLTAESDAWHIEEGEGAKMMRGTATSFEDAREKAVEHFLATLKETSNRLEQARLADNFLPKKPPARGKKSV